MRNQQKDSFSHKKKCTEFIMMRYGQQSAK